MAVWEEKKRKEFVVGSIQTLYEYTVSVCLCAADPE